MQRVKQASPSLETASNKVEKLYSLIELKMEPVGLEVSEEGTIFISWSDGHRGRHAPFALRSACPCAMCHGEPGIFGKYYQVPGTQIKADVQPEEIESVGRYGLKILWSDGHDIGIYTYEYLRRLCECEECRVSKSG